MQKIKKIIKRIKQIIVNHYYINKYYNSKIKNNIVLIESKTGQDLAGNMFYILKELQNQEFKYLTKYIVYHKKYKNRILSFIKHYNIKDYKLVRLNSFKYYKLLATAKYLFNDTSFEKRFIKKEGQVYTNTWHGTPLKHMSNDVPTRRYAMGNVKRNFLMADYLVYPNKEMQQKMLSAYSIEQLYDGYILNIGYPRNAIFFNRNREKEIREELELQNKQIIVYMPTWRGDMTKKQNSQQNDDIKEFLELLDDKLNDNQILYVKLHVFNKNSLDLSEYEHIKDFPNGYETYDFLNVADVLITDYSSVFFDFANTKKKIILFSYDQEEYTKTRGLYYDINEFPFEKAHNIKELVSCINNSKNGNYDKFLKEFATYDNHNACKQLLDIVINGKKNNKFAYKLTKNEKENVLIYGSTLALNGITSSLKSLLNVIDLNQENIFISFRESAIKKNATRLNDLPNKVHLFPICDGFKYTIGEIIAYILFFRFDLNYKFINKKLDQLYKREILRFYGSTKFDKVIHYTGYEKRITNLFQRFDCNKAIFVHSNMVSELQNKGNQHFNTLKNAYNKFDKVCIITKDTYIPTLKIGGNKNNIVIFPNAFDNNNILDKANKEIFFDKETLSNVKLKTLKDILENKKYKKIINIGRFSDEKGQLKLIKAFEKHYAKHSNVFLLIIGGYGPLWRRLNRYVQKSKVSKNVILIKYMTNPYSVLKKCHLFVLSSNYEALGLVLLEAATLNVPCFSTNIPGPKGFMKKHGGILVKNSEAGIISGFKLFDKKKVPVVHFDVEEYNKDVKEAYYNLFSKGVDR